MNLTKRTLDALASRAERYFVWDDTISGFGVRVEASGRKTFVCRYRQSGQRRQYTLGRYGVITPEEARAHARRVLAASTLGKDPAKTRQDERVAVRFADLVVRFLEGHGSKLKPRTLIDYESALRSHIVPAIGHLRAEAIGPIDLNRIHVKLAASPHRANRVMAYVGSVYSWAGRNGFVPKGYNPASDVNRFREAGRERYLSGEELERLGLVLRQAETEGLPFKRSAGNAKLKQRRKPEDPSVPYPKHVIAAVRLLLFTGCRLREILNLRWKDVDLERGALLLSDSKTGRRAVLLNGAAVAVLSSLEHLGSCVVPGTDPNKPRHDLKRPWDHIRAAAGLEDVRLHDLRHTHASIGAGSGFGLPVLGRLLGHASPMTTQRYAHLADDPLRRASEAIGDHLVRALRGEIG